MKLVGLYRCPCVPRVMDNPLFNCVGKEIGREARCAGGAIRHWETPQRAAEGRGAGGRGHADHHAKAGRTSKGLDPGPQVAGHQGLAEQYSRALGATIARKTFPYDERQRPVTCGTRGQGRLGNSISRRGCVLHRGESLRTDPLMTSNRSPVNPRHHEQVHRLALPNQKRFPKSVPWGH